MKRKYIIQTVSFLTVLLALGLCLFLLPPKTISESERRPLTQFQSYADKKAEAEKQGQSYSISQYFSFLEQYMLDQFPARDSFRSIKAVTKKYMLGQKDNNGYYYADGSLGYMDKENNDQALSDSVNRLNAIFDRYFAKTNSNVYYSIIPDKNYYLAEKNGYLCFDHDAMYSKLENGFREQMKKIDIRDLLAASSYYKTDPHWEQTKLLPVADRLLRAMGATGTASEQEWTVHSLAPYYGTYYGHAALPVGGESMNYLTGPHLDGITVQNMVTGEIAPIYVEEKFNDSDPYDVFMGGGVVALLKINNPNASSNKQLVVFRDSFGSSMIPLLISEYAEIIVVDIRYASPSALPNYVRFRYGCDVLFLYSTTVLNTYGTFLS